MRKVLSFVLALSLVLGSFSMAFAANVTANPTPNDVKGTDCEEAVTVLSNLGVITGYEDGSYKPEGIVNRAEAVVVVIKALGLNGSVGNQKSSYTDLSGYGWAEGYIAFATQLGIVNGYGDGTFRPGQTVNYNEFATMLVRALGYTDVSLTGTWPAKYVNQASAVGIMDDVKSGGSVGANRGDVAIMANNALTAYIGTVDQYNKWNPTIKSGSEAKNNAVYDTMIGRLGGYFYKGVITDGMDSNINIRPYIGKYCEYYTDEKDGKGNVLTISKVKSTNIKGSYEENADSVSTSGIIFKGDDDVDYKMGNKTTEPDDDSYVGISYFYNGEESDKDVVTTSNATELSTELSGKTVKTLYSVMAWEPTSADQVTSDDLTDITDKQSLMGSDFDTDRSDKIINTSFELIGVNSLNDIKADNIVYVYDSNKSGQDDVIRRVAVGTETVEGQITKIDSKNEKWTIDGKVYSFSDADGASKVSDAEAGDTVKVWLDGYGDIYKVDSVSGSAKDYAVIQYMDKDRGDLKLFMADESSKMFGTDLNNKVWDNITKEAVKNSDPAVTRLVGYSLNKNNDVNSLYPGKTWNADDKALTKLLNDATTVTALSDKVVKFEGSGGSGEAKVDSKVVVFTYDGNDFGTVKMADVDKQKDAANLNNNRDSVSSFTNFEALVRDGKIVAILVDDQFAGGTSTDSYGFFGKEDQGLNSDKDKAQELTGVINGKSGVFKTSGETTFDGNVDVVTAYKLRFNDSKDISKVDAVDAGVSGAAFGKSTRLSDGYVNITSAGVTNLHAIANNAYIYELTLDKDDNLEYRPVKSGTVSEGKWVWLFETDSDSPGYDLVVYAGSDEVMNHLGL